MRCLVCPVTHVPNTIFCDECGVYLLKGKELSTDPIDLAQIRWLGGADDSQAEDTDLPQSRPLTIRLRIGIDKSSLGRPNDRPAGNGNQARELQVSLIKPIRLGRNDPMHDIFPEVDLTQDLGKEYGISREHTRIFQRGNAVKVEDLGSTNGTLLNGERLDPYMSEALKDGDQLQIGKLLIEVTFAPENS